MSYFRMLPHCIPSFLTAVVPFLLVSFHLAPLFCEAESTDNAKAKFLEGAAYFANENYAEAYRAFKTSYEMKPVLTVLYNIAMCEMILGDYVQSLNSFTQLIHEGDGVIPDDFVEKAKSSMAELKSLVGTLTIKNAPPGALLHIDDNRTESLPLNTPLLLNPGNYTIRVTHDNFEPLSYKLVIESGKATIVQAAVLKEKLPQRPLSTTGAADTGKLNTSNPNHGKLTSNSLAHSIDSSTTAEESVFYRPHRASPLFIAGLSNIGLGVAGLTVGGVCTYWQRRNLSNLDAAERTLEKDGDYQTYLTTYKDIEKHRFPAANLGIKIGYIAGGVLTAAGIVMVTIDRVRHKGKNRTDYTLFPTTHGVGVYF